LSSVVDRTLYEENLAQLEEAARRVIAARVTDPHTIDDLVQETLTRVMEASKELSDEAELGYAIVIAKNLVAALGRSHSRGRRLNHKLIDLREPERPEELVVKAEERRALKDALTRVADTEREALIAHEVLGVETAKLAPKLRTTPGGVATRMARTRAQLRVDYLLALRGVELPTDRCRRVLLALSAGDTRRQTALNSGRHLLECPTCASLSPVLLTRRRALAGLAPLLFMIREWFKSPAGKAVSGTVAVGAVAVIAWNLMDNPSTSPPPAPERSQAPIVTLRGDDPVSPGNTGGLEQFAGERVSARDVLVESVASDEGFWVSAGNDEVVWVQLITDQESNVDIDRGDVISFVGKVVRNEKEFINSLDLDSSDAQQLRTQGFHIEARERGITEN
jgi:RNA polymerase sigma factor (sigma-70 family)